MESKVMWAKASLLGLLVLGGCALEDPGYQDDDPEMDADAADMGDAPDMDDGARPDGGDEVDFGLPPGTEATVSVCQFDDQVRFYTLDLQMHAQGQGTWAMYELEPLNTDGPVACGAALPEATEGREAVIQFTAPDDGLYQFVSPDATTMALASMCNLSRQFVACAQVPHPMAEDFSSTPRVLQHGMRAGETVYLTLETADSQPVDLLVQAPRFAGDACTVDLECLEGLLCQSNVCSPGSAPELFDALAWRDEERLTFRVQGLDAEGDLERFMLELTGLDTQGQQLWSQQLNSFRAELIEGRGFVIQGEISTSQRITSTLIARVQDNAGNWSQSITAQVEPLPVRALDQSCDPSFTENRCQGALACLLRRNGAYQCTDWEVDFFSREGGYSYRVRALDAQPSPLQRAKFHLGSRDWFDTEHPLVALDAQETGGHFGPGTYQTDASHWERVGIVTEDSAGLADLSQPPSEVSVFLNPYNRVVDYDNLRFIPVRPLPRPALREACDRHEVVDLCASGLQCTNTGQSWSCQPSQAPVIEEVRWYGDPNSGTFGLEVTGTDINGDVETLELVRVDANGETFPNAERATRALSGDLNQYGYTSLQVDGERFTVTFSIQDWPFTFLPNSESWSLTLLDKREQRSQPVYSPNSGQPARQAAAGEVCDPLGQVSGCAQGLACDRLDQLRRGFVCLPETTTCQPGQRDTSLAIEESGDLHIVGAATEEMGPQHCGGNHSGPDAIYWLRAPQAGLYHIWAQGLYGERLDLSVQRSCSLPHSSQLACSISGTPFSSVALELEQGEEVYIHVQVAYQPSGQFELSIARE